MCQTEAEVLKNSEATITHFQLHLRKYIYLFGLSFVLDLAGIWVEPKSYKIILASIDCYFIGSLGSLKPKIYLIKKHVNNDVDVK